MSGEDRARNAHIERGAGLMSTSFGVLVFLLLLGFTVQFMFHLHARSVVRSELYAATSDAVALASDRGCAVAAANLESQFPSRLGAMGELSTIDAVCGAGFLRAHVRVDPPSAIPSFFGEVGFLGSIERTVEIRLEELQ